MVGLRLFLPESWTSDPVRMAKARVPSESQLHDQARDRLGRDRPPQGGGRALRLRVGRRRLRIERPIPSGAQRARVGLGRRRRPRQKVYPADVALIFPVAGRGRPRKNHVPDVTSLSAEKTLASASWRTLSRRRGTKGPLRARFAAVRIRVADGAPQRIGDMGQQHLPGEEAWLIGEHRATGERKYYLSNLPAATPRCVLAGAVKARWACEQAHQQLKEELGLDHFEGRSWGGLHRHALMTMIAYAFLQSRRLNQARRGKKKINGPPPQPSLPAVRHIIVALIDHSHRTDARTVEDGLARETA